MSVLKGCRNVVGLSFASTADAIRVLLPPLQPLPEAPGQFQHLIGKLPGKPMGYGPTPTATTFLV